MNEDKKFELQLTINEVETILVGLNELPHKQVRGLIDKVVNTINSQTSKGIEKNGVETT